MDISRPHPRLPDVSAAAAVAVPLPATATPPPEDTHRSETPQITLDRLIDSGRADGAVQRVVEHRMELISDELSIVAAFSDTADQLALRQVNDNAYRFVDPQIHTLTTTGRNAIRLLSEANTISRLSEIQLSDCDDDVLVALAEQLLLSPNPRATLTLWGNENNAFSERGLQALAALRLAGLALRSVPITPAMSQALSQATYPVMLSLPPRHVARLDVAHISQIPTLETLDTHNQFLSEATIATLRTHPSLIRFSIEATDAEPVCAIASNPHLRCLNVGRWRSESAPAFAALAENQTLAELSIIADDPNALALLARNTAIETLSLRLTESASRSLPHLAQMRALKNLSLMVIDGERRLPDSLAIQAICAMPLDELNLTRINLDKPTLTLLAAANARHLTIAHGGELDFDDIDRLNANASINRLSLRKVMSSETAQHWVRGIPATLERADISISSDTPEIDRQRLQDAWNATGRPPLHLGVEIQ